jgi:hypothetical protein
MLKLFNKGHLSQKDSAEPFATSSAFQQKRQGSLRNLNYFGPNATSVDFITPVGKKELKASTTIYATSGSSSSRQQYGGMADSKKYVSCENVSRLTEDKFLKNLIADNDDEDEDELDENGGIKVKLTKRYNSLTNMLMKSFRKAKIKKRRELAASNRLETNYEEEGDMTNEMSMSEAAHLSLPERSRTLQLRMKEDSSQQKNSATLKGYASQESLCTVQKKNSESSRATAQPRQETAARPSGANDRENVRVINTYLSQIEKSNESELERLSNENENESNDEEDSEAVPVFKGVKLISTEFVELKPLVSKPKFKQPVTNNESSTTG